MNPEAIYISYLMRQNDKDVTDSLERVIRTLKSGEAQNAAHQLLLQQDVYRQQQVQECQERQRQLRQQKNFQQYCQPQPIQQSPPLLLLGKPLLHLPPRVDQRTQQRQRWLTTLNNIRFPEYINVITCRINCVMNNSNSNNASHIFQDILTNINRQQSIRGALLQCHTNCSFLNAQSDANMFYKKFVSWCQYRIYCHIKLKTNKSDNEVQAFMIANGTNIDNYALRQCQGENANKLVIAFGPIIFFAQEIFSRDIFDNLSTCDAFIETFEHKKAMFRSLNVGLVPVASLLESIERRLHQISF